MKNEIEISSFSIHEKGFVNKAALLLERAFPNSYNGIGLDEIKECLSEDRVAFKATRDGEFLGFVSALEAYKPYGWELHPLVVADNARKMGIGRKLVGALEKALSERGVLTVFLGTDDERFATSLSDGNLFENLYEKMANVRNYKGHPYEFYEKAGYQIVGVIPNANGWNKPDIIMAKNIAKNGERYD
ncbi:GNAT family N-acetyltransferase [Proteiniclasticum ruminis]|uniref:Aminoglycoside 6'-N-acetyltransferase I n=1 Tax=Proteiniclasticum ruminis TaxID=398199 RepID=A0A1G8IC31_9CLOT|nr:GNAT family N-acetyltransferase [Proteiniclasticum ruminis]SDI16446.1 aminoglycoside 6'-N-acetyltransferase I [Proteiniclasticum ruminis]